MGDTAMVSQLMPTKILLARREWKSYVRYVYRTAKYFTGNSKSTARSIVLKKPLLDPTCMSVGVLRDAQSGLRFEDGPLYWLETAGSDTGLRKIDSVATSTERQQAGTELESDNPDIRVFFLSHIFEHLAPNGFDPREKGIMRFSIGLCEEALSWLFEHQGIHPMFLESLHSHVSQYALYESLDTSDKPSYLHICAKVAPAGHLEAAFYINYDYSTNHVTAIVAGNDLDNHLQMIADNLKRTGPPRDPFALASILITRYFRFLEAQKIQVDHAVIMTEQETGRGAVAYSDNKATHAIDPGKFDLTFMHWIEGNQRNIVYAAESQVKLATFLIEEHMQYIKQRNTTYFERHKLTGAERAVHERLKSHKQLVEGLHAASLIIRERIQRQLSAADSIINQSDNKVSLTNAEANTKIAAQSKRIAEETRRDSTSMKTIPSLTMVYLPSTFAATVFGTGFFTYQDGDQMAFQINVKIWILVVVSVLLSFLTVGIWVWINKYGIPKQLGWARQNKADKIKDAESGMTISGVNGSARPPLTIVSRPKVSLPVGSDGAA